MGKYYARYFIPRAIVTIIVPDLLQGTNATITQDATADEVQ